MSNALSLLSTVLSAITGIDLGGGAGIGIAIGFIVLIIRGSERAVVMGREGDPDPKNGGICISA